jgi:uncharacterized protein YdaT
MALPRWNAYRYPSSMAFLRPAARAKAIEIANALVREGRREDEALRLAIDQAKQWDKRRARGVGEGWT